MSRYQCVILCSVLSVIGVTLTAKRAWAHDSGVGIARYLPDGALDHSFGADGLVVIHTAQSGFVANALALQADGRILVGGTAFSYGSSDARRPAWVCDCALLPDGRLDTRFGTAAESTCPPTTRKSAGWSSPDQTFGDAGIAKTTFEGSASGARAVAVQADGKLITGGAKSGGPAAAATHCPRAGSRWLVTSATAASTQPSAAAAKS